MTDDEDHLAPETPAQPAPKRKKKPSKAESEWFSGTEDSAEAVPAGGEEVPPAWDETPVAAPDAWAEAPIPDMPGPQAGNAWTTPENGGASASTPMPAGTSFDTPSPENTEPRTAPQQSPPPPPAQSSAPLPIHEAPQATVFMPSPPKASSGRVEVGSVLNGIYRVTRLIARGGMGEVFEGENINSDERVAIKVILEHLAKDENVLAMFRKEAKTLTRLSHPALVQYRVLAQEPSLQAFYIVTEFIDGAPLSDVYRTLKPTPEDLISLLKRLAQGLEAAHDLGAVHRDISLDNILLPHGKLDQAKVIDFGIAKDLDAHSGTIVGDGFAGKLGYVAPEQFGAYDRAVGPWTDVYSLALVILSVAGGKPFDMGATLMEAVAKRQSVPDVNVAPEILRPLLTHMLEPDPKNRLRSMTQVLAEIAQLGQKGLGQAPAAPVTKSKVKPPKADVPRAAAPVKAPTGGSSAPAASDMKKLMPFIGVAAAVAVVVIGGGLFMMLSPHKPANTGHDSNAAAATGRSPGDVRLAVGNALAKVDCSWVEVTEPQGAAGSQSMTVSGVAANAGLISRIASEAAGSGVEVVSDVQSLQPSACAVLDSFRKFRAPPEAVPILTLPVRNYTMLASAAGCDGDGSHAKAVVDIAKQPDDYTLMDMESQGWLQQLGDKAQVEQLPAINPQAATLKPDGTVEINNCVDEKTFARSNGLQAVMLVIGKGPFTLTPLNPGQADTMAVPASWSQTFEQNAAAKGWRTEMAWFHVTK